MPVGVDFTSLLLTEGLPLSEGLLQVTLVSLLPGDPFLSCLLSPASAGSSSEKKKILSPLPFSEEQNHFETSQAKHPGYHFVEFF